MSIDRSRRDFLQNAGMGIGWLAALDLFQKTGVRTRGQLVRVAVEQYENQL